MTRPRNPNAGRTCNRCRKPLPRRRQPYGPTAQCARCLAEQRDRLRLARAGERDDLFEAAGAPTHWEDRQAFHQALSRAVGAGHVERRKARAFWSGRDCHSLNSYRITPAGRAELARRLTIDMEIADDEPATDERSAAA